MPRKHPSLAAYLQATNQTQEQFADVLSRALGRRVSQGNVSLYVSGQQMPRPKLAILISQISGVSVEAMSRANARFHERRAAGRNRRSTDPQPAAGSR